MPIGTRRLLRLLTNSEPIEHETLVFFHPALRERCRGASSR